MLRQFLVLSVLALAVAACDAGFEGDLATNQPPDTELSVRAGDLTQTLGDRRLISTVELAWSGTDSDGVVTSFDVRSYPDGQTPGGEDGWNRTAARDSTLRLAIPVGETVADVVVEVRSVDDDGVVDPDPARTVFPIINSNPALRIVEAEAPPDSTWPVISFSLAASDVDGDENLEAIEIALNDTTSGFVRLPADATFITLVADDPSAQTSTVSVFTGRGFRGTGLQLPGLRLDADNVVYLRSVDQAEATSPTLRYPGLDEDGQPLGDLFVRRVTSRVLLVNDVRVGDDTQVLGVARAALAAHGSTSFDEWDLSETPQSTASPVFSDALPVAAEPTLRQALALWDRIYWVSNAVTNTAAGNNLPRAATVMDLFFEDGGRLLVQVPVSLPRDADAGAGNAAIDLLPISTLIEFPSGVRALRANAGTPVRPQAEVPGTGQTLPPLEAARLITSALPYNVGPDDVPLYEMAFYENNRPEDVWQGSQVLASIRQDRRVGLFSLPLFAGPNLLFEPATASGDGVVEALALLLDGLDFPTGSGRLAAR
ncbi:MAG: hypothetical protein AAGK21_01785 [Bacteroidota bacterium]